MTKNMKTGVSTNCRLDGMSRRRVLEFGFGLAFGTSGGARLAMAQSAAPPPCPENVGMHNMMVFGERSVFLSHLPMFLGLCPDRAHFQTEHRFQFIVEATFEQPRTQRDVTELYKQDRQRHRDIRMYSLGPRQAFALAEVFVPPGSGEPRKTFRADVQRGHLERPPHEVIQSLRDIDVRIKRVVHAHEFRPEDARPENLEYLLIGTPGELFLVHRIAAPGDFDQILPVRVADQQFSDADLRQAVRVIVPGRPNASSSRLRGGQNADAQLMRAGSQAQKITLQALREIYFEESELAIPPTEDTQEEHDSGF